MNSRVSLRVGTVGARSRKVGGTVIGRAREVRPLDRFHSIKVKLGVLVVASVSVVGIFTAIGVSAGIQARYVVSVAVILSLGVTQILAHGMTSPLRSMADAVESIARGDYSRRVTTATSRDEVGQLAAAFNLMAADLEAVDRQRKELIANVSHELRTPISALRAVLENVVDGVTEPDPPTMRLALEQPSGSAGWSARCWTCPGSTPARSSWTGRTWRWRSSWGPWRARPRSRC